MSSLCISIVIGIIRFVQQNQTTKHPNSDANNIPNGEASSFIAWSENNISLKCVGREFCRAHIEHPLAKMTEMSIF